MNQYDNKNKNKNKYKYRYNKSILINMSNHGETMAKPLQ